MCRSTDYDRFVSLTRDRLKIRFFTVRFSALKPARNPLPHSLTLVFLPTIDHAKDLHISGSKIPPHSPAFLSLPRHPPTSSSSSSVSFGSGDRVVASDGARFEVYLREARVLKGVLRRDWEEERGGWRLELASCPVDDGGEIDGLDSSEVELTVSAEGHVAMRERVEVRRRRRRATRRRFEELEEIPEEREEALKIYECECCDCGEVGLGSDGGDEIGVEGVGWAVDVGIWVMCLGVGLLVSKASSKTLRRRRMFF